MKKLKKYAVIPAPDQSRGQAPAGIHNLNLLVLWVIPVLLLFSFNAQAKDSYSKILKKSSRGDEIYKVENLKAFIIWKASPLTDELIAAQTNRYAKSYDPLPEEKENFQKDLFSKRGDESLFFISFYSADRKYGDLSNPKAKWDVKLKVNGETLTASRIEKINSPNPLDLLLYPYLTPWSRGYYVWFPINASRLKTPFSLSVHGAFASSTLSWKK